MKKFFKYLFILLICAGIAFVGVRFGPAIYYRYFSGGDTSWISERFSEELKEKNELIVFETTLTGQDVATQDAWLIGTVQEVSIPYSYAIQFVVDLSHSQIVAKQNAVEVHLPSPKANYAKLTVDEDHMKKRDLLYPLTPERYAEIKEELEARLFAEASTKAEYLDAAWKSAVSNVEGLFQAVLSGSAFGANYDIQVVMDDSVLLAFEATPSPAASPIPTP